MTQQYPAQQPAPAPKKKRKWPWIIVAILGVGFLVNVVNQPSARENVAARSSNSAPAAPAAPVANAVADDLDPLTTDGQWLVGTEVQPGVYRAVRADGAFFNQWKRCSDITCDIGAGAIDFGGPGLIEVQPSDYALEVTGLVLTPMP